MESSYFFFLFFHSCEKCSVLVLYSNLIFFFFLPWGVPHGLQIGTKKGSTRIVGSVNRVWLLEYSLLLAEKLVG